MIDVRYPYTAKRFQERPITILNEVCVTCGGEDAEGLPLISVGGGKKQCRDCIGRPVHG